jgi:hypothetical protein
MRIKKVFEHAITSELHSEISTLRDKCFPEDAVGRSYAKQLPHLRFLAFEGETLIGHLGVDHRVISVGGSPYTIFGVIDVCVSENSRGSGIAGILLKEVTQLAHSSGIDFCVLFAKDQRLYRSHGFSLLPVDVIWLRIHEHQNYGVGRERIESEFMILQTGNRAWPVGEVDLLGYLF